MGEAELNRSSGKLVIRSVIYTYGEAATPAIAWRIANDISTLWNEPNGKVKVQHRWYEVVFDIESFCEPQLNPELVWYNVQPRLNFFRVEEFALGNISFVDGIGCNTGYFKLDNLLQTATTAAHEYGHTLGLVHPQNLDYRGKGIPGIMYPRGTLVDPLLQYDPAAEPGKAGGTLNPVHRKVQQQDIDALQLDKISYNDKGLGIVGSFSSQYHQKHTVTTLQ